MRIHLVWPDEGAQIGLATVYLPKRVSSITRYQKDLQDLRTVESVLKRKGVELIHGGWRSTKNQRQSYVRQSGGEN